jgi:tetratricopeptide (TPR) repeat protein
MTTSTNYGIVAGYSMIDVVENGHIKNKVVAGLSGSNVDMTCAFVVFCNNTTSNGKDVISAMSADDMYLRGCGFSSPTEGSTVSGPGDIYWDSWTSCSGLPKKIAANEILTGNDDPPSSLEKLSEEKKLAGRDDYKNYRSLREKMYKENEGKIIDFKKYEMKIDDIVSQFRAIIKTYPGSISSLKSFQNIIGCYDILQKQQLGKQIAEELLSDENYKDVRSHIKLRSVPLLIEEQDYDGALILCDEVINEMPKSSEAVFLLYNKGIIFEIYKNDDVNARKMYEELINQYPNSMYAYLAGRSLGKENIPQKSVDVQNIETIDIMNYPNPFNPETTIKYRLSEDGFVTLRIYDVLGREVKLLVNEQKAKGEYSVNFDASTLVSGMYFYQLKVNNFISTKKMILLK